MKIRTKIQWYSSLFLTVMLVVLSVFVLLAFLWISIEREEDMLENQASLIEDNVSQEELFSGESKVLEPYVPDDGMVRAVDRQGRVVNRSADEEDLEELGVRLTSDEYDFEKVDGEYALVYRVAFPEEGRKVATLEVARTQESLWEQLSTLALVLASSSLVVILLAIIGSKWLAKRILNPISVMSRTMKEIEESGEFKEVPIPEQTKDELQVMGASFNKMIGRLEQNFAQQQKFLSDASHELKTPITVIESYASLLKRWGMKDPAIQEEAVEAIHHEAIRMKKLTGSLLQAASQASHEAPPERVELAAFTEQIAQTFRRTSGREVIVDCPYAELPITMVRDKLEQVLVILLDNGMKYSDDIIRIEIEKTEDRVEISVKDRGIGIPAEHLPHVFDRFYRVDSSRARKTGGNGLGLSIAKTIVESLNGKLQIQSEEGKGTAVKISFSHQILMQGS